MPLGAVLDGTLSQLELAKGLEPPTC